MSNVQGKKAPASKRARSGSFKQGKKSDMVVAYKATNVPRNKLASWGASGNNSVYVCHSTAFPLPDRLVNKLKTSQVFTLTTGASGAFASSQIRLNDTSDPFVSIGSNQPRFYDQIAAIYANNVVYGCKIKIKLLKQSGGDTSRLLFVPSRNTTVPIASCYADADELPKTMRWDISNGTAGGDMPLTEKKEKSIYVDIGSFWGKNRQQMLTEEGFASIAGASPTYQVYGYFCTQELEATNTPSMVFEVTLTQYVAWSNVISVASST